MANRSYLYSIGFDRTLKKREKGEKIFGLSEANYSIPLSFKILVSQNSKISESINWDYKHPIAIQGDFKAGRKKLFDFLDDLSAMKLFDPVELNDQIKETKEFLNNKERELDFVILECGELYEMEEEEFGSQNKKLYEETILKIDNEIGEYLYGLEKMNESVNNLEKQLLDLKKPAGIFSKLVSSDKKGEKEKMEEKIKKEIRNVHAEKWHLLGINYWSDILYFHFENE